MTETDATPPARRRGVIAALVVVALALAVGGGFWLRSLLLAPQSDTDGAPATLRLESATRAGEDPFTASVVAPEHDVDAVFSDTIVARTVEITQQAATDSTTGAAQVPAAAPGLYGGSGELSACDPSALVDYLVADGVKAAAWSGVIGIAAESIPEYVAGLTAVVLTVDTLVTNHGFAAGAATAHQSLLQAGTAILVDARGLPVVRCACGNPLLPPRFSGSAIGADTIGTAWDGLDLQRVVTVTPAPADLSGFTVADLATGDLVEIPVGGTTAVDGVYLATSSNHAQVSLEPEPLAGSIQTSPDGVDWTVALETTPML
ncbi:DUF6777 domain-containing protein, partial [Pseudactinotalea sp.]|uniref:DUF6777 domain-containing protein n=1 Tax=Pseudactinotalea sp. TaxID=1926260 RepID=UPI003B3AB3F2